jgi:hypothetical protein
MTKVKVEMQTKWQHIMLLGIACLLLGSVLLVPMTANAQTQTPTPTPAPLIEIEQPEQLGIEELPRTGEGPLWRDAVLLVLGGVVIWTVSLLLRN